MGESIPVSDESLGGKRGPSASEFLDKLRQHAQSIEHESEELDDLIGREVADLEEQRRETLFEARLEAYEAVLEQRENYANRIFWLISSWLAGMGTILILQGFALRAFELSESVLYALVGGTTINVIGIFAIVAKYFFSSESEPSFLVEKTDD